MVQNQFGREKRSSKTKAKKGENLNSRIVNLEFTEQIQSYTAIECEATKNCLTRHLSQQKQAGKGRPTIFLYCCLYRTTRNFHSIP